MSEGKYANRSGDAVRAAKAVNGVTKKGAQKSRRPTMFLEACDVNRQQPTTVSLLPAAHFGQQPQDLEVQPHQRDH